MDHNHDRFCSGLHNSDRRAKSAWRFSRCRDAINILNRACPLSCTNALWRGAAACEPPLLPGSPASGPAPPSNQVNEGLRFIRHSSAAVGSKAVGAMEAVSPQSTCHRSSACFPAALTISSTFCARSGGKLATSRAIARSRRASNASW